MEFIKIKSDYNSPKAIIVPVKCDKVFCGSEEYPVSNPWYRNEEEEW